MTAMVILGAGHAGINAAIALRQEGFDGTITLVEEEGGLPYQKPPLSKGFLLGKIERDGLRFRPADFFDSERIELVTARALAVDRVGRTIALANGQALTYDRLLFAVGARNRQLPLPGISARGVLGLRSLADADRLGAALETARRVVVIGGGFIGLEVAATARLQGKDVTVIEAADRLMARALSAEMSAAFRRLHEAHGVRLLTGTGVQGIVTENGRATGVLLADGSRTGADLVVLGVGVVPNTELAREAGLEVDNGIVVDTRLLTSDPAIAAIGDCAVFPSPHLGRAARLESVQNATDQARLFAAGVMGRAADYAALPWFWSGQFGCKLQIAGPSEGHDHVVASAGLAEGKGSVLCFRDGVLVAVETLNAPGEHMAARRVLARPDPLPVREAAQDGFSLPAWEAATRV